MEENRVSETLENILEKINDVLDYIGDRSSPDTDAKEAAVVFNLARSYDLLAAYDETAYQDGEYE
jgi:hypothetical protein